MAVFEHAQGLPQVYTDPDISKFIYYGYDDKRNLFVYGLECHVIAQSNRHLRLSTISYAS